MGREKAGLMTQQHVQNKNVGPLLQKARKRVIKHAET